MSAIVAAIGEGPFVRGVIDAMPERMAVRTEGTGGGAPARSMGIAQATAVFPLAEPVELPGGAIAALRGYVSDAAGLPRTPDAARALVRSMASRLLSEGRLVVDGTDLGGVFSLVAATPTRLAATADPTGLYPIYYLRTARGMAIASHARPLARAAARAVDWSGTLQTAAFGYTLGARTIYDGVRQLTAGAAISMELGAREPTVVEQSAAFGPLVSYRSGDDAADALWDDFQRGLRQVSSVSGPAGMLMSGGFDTRFVALAYASLGRPITALTIGDPDNFECRIARRVAELTGARWRSRTAQSDLDTLREHLDTLIARAETATFPTSDRGGEELAADGAVTLSTGFGGETVLGGQGTGQFIATTRTARLLSAATRSIPSGPPTPPGRAELEAMHRTMIAYHGRALRQLRNRVPAALQAEVDRAIGELDAELHDELTRLARSQPGALAQLVERFWMEHHVRKHFGRQELTLDLHAPLLLPTIATALYVRASNIDPRLKTDHGVYLRLVRRHWGEFARIPTSNIPIPLSSPPVAIWAARTLRALWDDRQTKRQMRTRGERGKRFGWSNYEVWLRRSPLFDALPALIDARLISPEWLARKLAKQRAWQEKLHSGQEYLIYITLGRMLEGLL